MKLPSIHLYPGDWLRDPVAGCSLAAQGLWLRMMFIAHDSERYGYLSLNGSPMQVDSIARRAGCSLPEFETLYAELELAGIPSRTPEGIIFSRRMVKDAKERSLTKDRVLKHRMKRSCNAHVTPNEDDNEVKEKERVQREKESPPEKLVLRYLNDKAQRNFREIDASLVPIRARLKEKGVTVEGVFEMIDAKITEWKDTEMEKHLTPETLFRPSKFSKYYDTRKVPPKFGKADDWRKNGKHTPW